MNARFFTIATFAALTWTSLPAYADWQYTRWGMTLEEVHAASGGAAHPPEIRDEYPDSNLVHLLNASYSSREFTFVAKFIFTNLDSLVEVKLEPDPHYEIDCSPLMRLLDETYGPGERKSYPVAQTSKWWDRESGNVVVYFEIDAFSCSIQYREFMHPGEAGGF